MAKTIMNGHRLMPNPWNIRHLSLDFTPEFDLVDGAVVHVVLRLVDAAEEDAVVLLVDDHFWISQANHIFRQCRTITGCEDNVSFVSTITYALTLVPAPDPGILPEGYLFLCPVQDLQAADGTLIERPECPAYWSLDPAGTPRLSPDDASRLGFPCAEMAEFHAAKGFAPTLYRRQMVWSMDEYFEGPLPG
ncbi:hypothetical protein B0H14DRAFT_2589881 [Mycena olivaceomarginata]|nr:hypothetical protein B0H14DRAFT_2589881 [Mycena olivaceomarginata]